MFLAISAQRQRAPYAHHCKVAWQLAMTEDARAKRARLALIGRGSHVTARGRSSLLRDVRAFGLPSALSERSFAIARRQVASTLTPYGPLAQECKFPTANGVDITLPVQAPLAMLSHFASADGFFSHYLREAYTRCPPTRDRPWRLIMYCDEITCGNPLRADTHKKVQGVYWSIMDLGPEALSDESCWFEVAALKSKTVAELPGGMSLIISGCVGMFVDGPDIREGIVLNVPGLGNVMIFCKLGRCGNILADVKALVEICLANGPNGSKCCFGCSRVVSLKYANANELSDMDAVLTKVTCLDVSRWGKHTDASFKQVLHRLRHIAENSPDGLAAAQTMHGFKHNASNVFLQRPEDDVAFSDLLFDIMHLFFVNGCFNLEFWALLEAVRGATRFTYGDMADAMTAWTMPQNACNLKRLLNNKHQKSCEDAGSFKCSASEGLTLYPLARRYVLGVVVPTGACAAEVRSFVALCKVIDLCMDAKNGVAVSPREMDDAEFEWLHLHQVAYGDTIWKPKEHYTGHLGDMLRLLLRRATAAGGRFFLPACWALERHHKFVKRFVDGYRNLDALEQGLCEELIVQKMHDLEEQDVKYGFVNPHLAPTRMKELWL